MISSRQHAACPSQRRASKDREVGRVTGPRWAGDKCGLNLLIYISYSLLSQGASEELECDSWKGLQRQFYPRAQDEIITLTWPTARATRWGSPSILGPGPWRLRSREVDSLPGTLAFLLRFYCCGWFHSCLLGTVPTQDYTACHTHANQAFVYSSALRISALPGTLCPYITCGDLNDYGLHWLFGPQLVDYLGG